MMSAPREDEEWRKQITSLLLEGAAFVLSRVLGLELPPLGSPRA